MVAYEVDSLEGSCIYRGNDLELACEIYDATPAAVLHAIRGSEDSQLRPSPVPWLQIYLETGTQPSDGRNKHAARQEVDSLHS